MNFLFERANILSKKPARKIGQKIKKKPTFQHKPWPKLVKITTFWDKGGTIDPHITYPPLVIEGTPLNELIWMKSNIKALNKTSNAKKRQNLSVHMYSFLVPNHIWCWDHSGGPPLIKNCPARSFNIEVRPISLFRLPRLWRSLVLLLFQLLELCQNIQTIKNTHLMVPC